MKYIVILILLFLVISCEEEVTKNEQIETKISKLSSNEYFLGDTITIEGKDFGTMGSDVMLFFTGNSDTLFISPSYKNIVQWSPNKIKFINDLDFEANFVYVGFNGIPYDSISIKNYLYPKIEVVEIASGTYLQGNADGFSDERVTRNVTISKTLLVARYELSQRLWAFVYNYNNSPRVNDNLPVSNVTWNEAILYCNVLSKMNGLDTCYIKEGNQFNFDLFANGWRLPTEAEWEYLAYISNIESSQLSQFAWYNDNSGYNAKIIGTKRIDQAGLYDLFGNVWEWCYDDYSNAYISGDVKDPINIKSDLRKVRRGGSYQSGELYCRKSNRTTANNSIVSTGIRLVRNK